MQGCLIGAPEYQYLLPMDITSTTTLNNGTRMPWLGFGVFQTEPGKEVENAVTWALEAGYRHIDTAAFYRNERGVGKAVASSGIPREELWITTKLWNDDQGYDTTLRAFDKSLRELDTDHVDLYLVHWPIKGKVKDTWKAFEKIYEDGRARAIGVSNFLVNHLDELLKHAKVTPMVDQVEWHPFVLQKPLLEYCKKQDIQFEAWSPLTRARFLDNPVLTEIAQAHGRSPAQVLIRWDLQHGVVSIPKSVHQERIEENSKVFDFELSSDEMQKLDSLDSNTRIGPHPDQLGGW